MAYAENNFMMAIGMDMIIIATGAYSAAALHPSVSQCSHTSATSLPYLHASDAESLFPMHFRETKPVAKAKQ